MISTKIFFVSCDGLYFDRFALVLISSIDINSPGQKIVFHIYNPTENTNTNKNNAELFVKSTELEFNEEYVDLNQLDEKGKAAFYACNRFVKFFEYFEKHKVSALFLDVDSIIKKDLMLLDVEYEKFDIAIHTRPKKKDSHMKLLAGVIWFDYNERTLEYLKRLSESLDKKNYSWFEDQINIYNLLLDKSATLKITHLEKKYIDWEFNDDSFIWVGKGERKDHSVKYLNYSQELARSFFEEKETVILCPRVDLGFKLTSSLKKKVVLSRLKDKVRTYWLFYPKVLKSVLEGAGEKVDIIVLPQWKVDENYINNLNYKKIYIAHKNNQQIKDNRAIFYMQEVYPYFFTADKSGWGGGSSVRHDLDFLSIENTKDFDVFNDYVVESKETKHIQFEGDSDFDYDVFFPLQIPNDETIRYYSDFELKDVVEAVIKWSSCSGVKILFKTHPVNKDISYLDLSLLDTSNVRFTDTGNIHTYISKSKAVFVVNSGVGFEALTHYKPVVNFGDAAYDSVTFKSTLQTIPKVYEQATSFDPLSLKEKYKKFLQWYLFENGTLMKDEFINVFDSEKIHSNIKNPFFNDIENALNIEPKTRFYYKDDVVVKNRFMDSLRLRRNSIELKLRRRKLRAKINKFDLNHFDNKSIAIVGNGQSILKYNRGKEIDSHQIVIRMNLGHPFTALKDEGGQPLIENSKIVGDFKDKRVVPVERHFICSSGISDVEKESYTNIKSVGSKTSVWSCSTADLERQKIYIKFFSDAKAIWIHPAVENLSGSITDKISLASDHYYKTLKKKYNIEPSSGLILLEMLHKSKAKNISLYGFDSFSSGHIARTNNTKKFFHSPDDERTIIDKYLKDDSRFDRKYCIGSNWVADHIKNKNVILINFGPYKKNLFRSVFSDSGAKSINVMKKDFELNSSTIEKLNKSCVFVWSILDRKYEDFFRKNNIKPIRVEDGFIHSIEKNSNSVQPYSWCFDKKGIYFDRRSSNELEDALNYYNIKVSKFYEELFENYLKNGVSKYNYQAPVDSSLIYGKKRRKRILVIGQVEDDKSIQYGMLKKMTNNELVWLAKEENPDAEVFYKPHPDVLTGKRDASNYSDPKSVESIATVLYSDMSVQDSLNTIDHVYTMTSLVGFESCLRGVKTTVLGAPFYSGWGLTDDRCQKIQRRNRKLKPIEMFICAAVLYPHYFLQDKLVNAEDIIELVASRKRIMQIEYKARSNA
jgi:capsule polysaccharide export protein KpsC/LpsZ